MDLKITNEEKHISKTPEIGSRYTPEQKSKLAKASKDFESLMTSMMLKSMNKTTGGLFGEDSYGGDMFDGMFENEISSFITKKHSLGVAEKLYKKITGEDLDPEVVKKLQDEEKKDAEPAETKPAETKPIEVRKGNSHPAVAPSSSSIDRVNRYDNIIEQASKDFGVDANVIKSVILAESAGNPKARSVAKAKGLMQLLDSTAKTMGVGNIWDPKENIYGGTKYLAGLLRQYNGDLKLALAAYNAGPGNVERYKGVPPFNETKNYISRVMGYLNHLNG